VSSTDLGFEPVLKSWLQNRKVELNRGDEVEKLTVLFNKYIFNMHLFSSLQNAIKQNCMPLSDVMRATQFMNLLTGLLQPLMDKNVTASDDEYEKYMIFSMVWAIGGLLEHADRLLFHEHLVQKNVPIPAKQN
jgi:dynein heavy chain